VPEGKGLSVVGGDISMENAILSAPDGQINLASVASPLDYGEVIPSQDTLQLTGFTKLGHLNISQLPTTEMPIGNVDVSGEGGGQIFIRGGQFTTQGAFIFSDTYGSKESKGIDIDIRGDINLSSGGGITTDSLSTGKSGNISITATGSISMQAQFTDATRTTISTNAYAKGDAGEIRIKASQLEMTTSQISSSPKEAGTIGQGGNIFITVGNLVLKDAAQILGVTFGTGKGGNINIQADSILLSAAPELYDWGLTNLGVPLSSSISVGVEPNATGAGGKISITANHLELQSNAFIISETLGPGKGGDIKIDVRDTFIISDKTGKTRSGLASLSDNYGANAGNIEVKAGSLIVDEGGFINTRAFQSSASGGEINLTVNNNLFLFNSTITAQAKGEKPGDNGGNLTIRHPHLFIMDSHSKLSAQANAGHGGNILIEADNFINPIPENVTATSEKSIDGEVTINAFQPNLAGMLTISSRNYLRLGLLKPPRWCGQNNRYKKPKSSFAIQLQEMLWPSPSDLRFYSPVLGDE
jgi:hypothetical protein